MPFGLTALSLGHISSEELQQALEYHRQNGGRIGDNLLELGLMSQTQVAAALSSQWGYPVLSLQDRPIQVSLQIPATLIKMYSMLPIQFIPQSKKLVVGMAEFVEHRILSSLEGMLNCTVVPCFITHEEFEKQLPSVLSQLHNEEVVFEQASSILEIARVTRSYARQIGALSANFSMCCDYVWSRLQGAKVAFDLLSRI